MATCNGERFLRPQIESLLAQTAPPAAIHVCDDASTDGTLDILEDYAQRGVLRYTRHTERQGVVRTFADAVGACPRGTDVALCDQDDVWMPEKLATTAALLQEADGGKKDRPAIAFSDLLLVDEDLKPLGKTLWQTLRIRPERERLESLLVGNFVAGCTVIMNPAMRAVMATIPAAAPMHDVWLALAGYTFGAVAWTEEPLVQYRQHSTNVTGATNRGETLPGKLRKNLRQISGKTDYLRPEAALAKLFRESHRARLSARDAETLYNFSRLADASWFSKKVVSLAARAYRWIPSKAPAK